MIIIGIIIIILFFTRGIGTSPMAYTGTNYYAASAVPFGTTTTQQPIMMNGGSYPVVIKRSIPVNYYPAASSNSTYTSTDGTQMTTTYSYQN